MNKTGNLDHARYPGVFLDPAGTYDEIIAAGGSPASDQVMPDTDVVFHGVIADKGSDVTVESITLANGYAGEDPSGWIIGAGEYFPVRYTDIRISGGKCLCPPEKAVTFTEG